MLTLGTPPAAAMDTGYLGRATLGACEHRGIVPHIATGREPHHRTWQERFASEPDPPPAGPPARANLSQQRRP